MVPPDVLREGLSPIWLGRLTARLDGIADLHAAGPHSHITGLARSGASIMEAKELARRADIRQNVKCIHIAMEDRAEALAALPSPFASADVDCLHYVCNSGGVLSQEVSPLVSDNGVGRKSKAEQAPAGPGLASSLVTSRHQLTVCGKAEAAGIAPAASIYQVVLTIALWNRWFQICFRLP